ncbi:hypothetical protein CWI71_03270 [Pseudidiomarina insulisalsae]|uniref:Penicillin-binding protein activator n=2 Tax=Pseudidiomarina insulisalsae TaxID=575789 RepID=A0A432YNA8_9GAMM|nr:hypothetical protein CWI71_03270 [Pseudidiomarina insulisalsae]
MLVCLLSACASPGKQREQVSDTPTQSNGFEQTEVVSSARTLNTLLEELSALPTVGQQLSFLLHEVEQLQQANEWQTSAALLSEIERHEQQLTASQRRQLQLAEVRWLASQGRYEVAQQQLQPLLPQLSGSTYHTAGLRLARDLAWQLQQPQQAAHMQLALLDAGGQAEPTDDPWRFLREAPKPDELQARSNAAQSWLALLKAAHQQAQGLDSSALQGWQLRHADHPGQAIAARVAAVLRSPKQQQALVLLPLSGPYAEQGQAVLDGMVMALEDQPNLQITVRDSFSFDFAQLAEELQRTGADTLIGPLLKDNIGQVSDDAVANVRWVALNSLQQLNATPTLWYALAPETEYEQVARTFAAKGYRQPLVLAADSARGREAIAVFSDAFQQQQPQSTVESGLYRTPDDMKAIVQEKLGVAASEARIWQVKITAGKILVDAEARSRADFDVIFLPGSIEQTRLLKPFIDVNISPFMQPIPVYATSASHIKGDALSENDLDNVRFTELPWLLPDHPQYGRLQQLLQQRSHWGYNLARLAAFGHDAVLLTLRQQQMAAIPGIYLEGLTGTLKWQPDALQRQLDWARYDGHEVVPTSEPLTMP